MKNYLPLLATGLSQGGQGIWLPETTPIAMERQLPESERQLPEGDWSPSGQISSCKMSSKIVVYPGQTSNLVWKKVTFSK